MTMERFTLAESGVSANSILRLLQIAWIVSKNKLVLMPHLWNMLLVLVTSVTAVPLLGLDLPREVAMRADLLDDHFKCICF